MITKKIIKNLRWSVKKIICLFVIIIIVMFLLFQLYTWYMWDSVIRAIDFGPSNPVTESMTLAEPPENQ